MNNTALSPHLQEQRQVNSLLSVYQPGDLVSYCGRVYRVLRLGYTTYTIGDGSITCFKPTHELSTVYGCVREYQAMR